MVLKRHSWLKSSVKSSDTRARIKDLLFALGVVQDRVLENN